MLELRPPGRELRELAGRRRLAGGPPGLPLRVAMCQHLGFHTPETRYDREAGLLRSFEICDDCGEALRELSSEPYLPAPKLAAA